jgi:hypothetical protein
MENAQNQQVPGGSMVSIKKAQAQAQQTVVVGVQWRKRS